MATIDEELGAVERDIRQLKIEYDQYFGGGRKRPPSEIEWRIEMIVKKYGERSGDMKIGQRFRFNNLMQTYAKYKDIFRKKLRQKEEGTVQRHFGAAAKAIEMERAQRQAAEGQSLASATEVAELPAFRITCSQPEQEAEKVDRLYKAFVEAKKSAGEEVGKLSHAGFAEFVRKKTKDLQKQNNDAAVEYVVEMVGGQVKLKALVKA
ncbi:MAG TPA: MXAN_5187 C-terminal domain-containing protein [Candidatus Acidoferrum sp.]|nr:MXAN_5187 C-terminal domain-containing protein [Candidatus Acidoferrum sp.]